MFASGARNAVFLPHLGLDVTLLTSGALFLSNVGMLPCRAIGTIFRVLESSLTDRTEGTCATSRRTRILACRTPRALDRTLDLGMFPRCALDAVLKASVRCGCTDRTLETSGGPRGVLILS
jgi:hypothetical protein